MTAESALATIIPHSRPRFGQQEIDAVTAVLRSGYVAQGPEVRQLETEWARRVECKGAVCVGSGLAAIRLSLVALGIGAGDEVIVPAFSCISILNAIMSTGATPVLADVAIDDWTLAIESVRRGVSRRTRAIIAVHLFGVPARLTDLAETGLPIIEDCAHGVGGFAGGRPFGSGGTVSVSSFYATKMIGAGEGGVVASDRAELLDRVRVARDPSDQEPAAAHLNDKMTDLEAALVRVQLRGLAETLSRREHLALNYADRLQELADRGAIVLPPNTEGRIWYRYTVRLLRHRALEVARRMQATGVFGEQPVWDLRGVVKWPGDLSNSDLAFDRVLSLPLYPDLSDAEQDRVVAKLADALVMNNS